MINLDVEVYGVNYLYDYQFAGKWLVQLNKQRIIECLGFK